MRTPAWKALSVAELRLWDVTNCLGATCQPEYTTFKQGAGGLRRVTVRIYVPKTAAIRDEHVWRFTQHRPSAREARQAAAHKATKFLRSRFRNVLDDSPWSSVPHYHRHVDEKEEEEEAHSDGDDLFGYDKRWFRCTC